MSEVVKVALVGGIAVITIDNPPVNALSAGVAAGIARAIDQIERDNSIRAGVLIGAGRTFVAGADIKELAQVSSGETCIAEIKPMLLRLEDCHKPIVMVIHGTAFGGGLELAMAGHYRVAVRDAQVGQPEVKLGIIPGAAVRQRPSPAAGRAESGTY